MSKLQQWEVHIAYGTPQLVNGNYVGVDIDNDTYEFTRPVELRNEGIIYNETVAVFPTKNVLYMIRCLEPEEAGDE